MEARPVPLVPIARAREFSRIGDATIAEFETYPARSLAAIETALADDDTIDDAAAFPDEAGFFGLGIRLERTIRYVQRLERRAAP